MKHVISNENIERLDEVSQEASQWRVSHDSVSYAVTVVRYFRTGGETVFGGYFKCISFPESGGDACGDFYPDESEALNDLLRRVAAYSPRRD